MDEFALRILFSFIVAGTWITLATIIAERFGSKVGGLIANLPSNILVSSFFIGWMHGPEYAAEVAAFVPAGMIMVSVFMFVFIMTVKKYGNLAFALSLFSWFVFALISGFFVHADIVFWSIVYMAITLILFLIIERWFHVPSMKKKNNVHYSTNELLFRAAFAGGAVAFAVAVASLSGPVWGGIFSTFPAVTLSTMYLLNRAQGPDFTRATLKVMLPASINIIVYVIAVNLTYPVYGIVAGTVISYLAAAAFVILFYPFTRFIK